MLKSTLLVAVCAALVLLPSVTATSTTTPTNAMPFQSWSCVTMLDNHPASASTFWQPQPPVATVPESQARASKFLYNLVWGPPNPFMVQSLNPNALNVLLSSSAMPTFATTQWSANITSGIANGFPMGCCNMTFGSLNVAELGCKNCINSGVTSLPILNAANDAAVKTNQKIMCPNNGPNGFAFNGGVQCETTTYVPGSKMDIWAGATNTGVVAQGTGVATLMFPSSSAGILAGGIYTFQLWAESICGVAKSRDVTLAARCPPSPVVSAVVRSFGGAITTPTSTLDFPYSVPVGTSVVVDASCSYPYLIQKPNWPNGQPAFTFTGGSSVDASNTAFFAARNLYAIQKIYFNAGDAAVTVATASVTANPIYYTASPMQDYWATQVTINSAGPHNVIITVTDGCSAAQAYVTITAQCACTPVAKVAYVPTMWSNEDLSISANPTTNMVNTVIGGSFATSFGPVSQPMGTMGTFGSQFGYTLTGTGFDFEEASQSNLAYDWKFLSWVPDFSQTTFSPNDMRQTVTQMFFPGSFPPQPAANCPTSFAGRDPLQCTSTNFASWGLSSTACCFSSSDIITDVGNFSRPNPGQFAYKILKYQSPATPLRSFTSGTRTTVYNFMRIGSGCNTAAPPGNDNWNSSIVQTAGAWTTPSYMLLPTYLDFSTALPWSNAQTTPQPQPFSDFNGLPSVNSGPSTNIVFLPTTECGAWLAIQQRVYTFTQTQVKFNTTINCGSLADLVICRVSVIQTGSFNSPTASLLVSSFGSCRGSWTFQLAVDDTCNTATDTFTVKVGCNRAPVVSAGCTNSQTWTSTGFAQINLDGRATFDPDNFIDTFNNIGSNVGRTYPGCLSTGTALCDNGGLGLRGLTYAWALISYHDSNGVNIYNTTSRQNCPTTVANINSTCTQHYCQGNFVYPWVNLYTQAYDASMFIPGTTGAAWPTGEFRTSPQGGSTLIEAWGTGFYAVTSVLTPSPNTLPVYNPGGSTMTMAKIFPDFNPLCAPTVYPMFVDAFSSSTPNIVYKNGLTTTTDWQYAEQLAHTGNMAYMNGLKKAGSYKVRLYAFDGCSVGSGDVTFTTSCPAMSFSSVSTTTLWNINATLATFQAGDQNYGYTPPFMQVNYEGTNDIPIGLTVTVWKQNTPLTTFSTVSTTPPCTFVQQTATTQPSGYRIMVPVATCSTFLSTLGVGTYMLQATADDGCQRTAPVVSLMSNVFAIACPATVLSYAGALGISPASRSIPFNVPQSGSGSGNFGTGLSFNITALARTATGQTFGTGGVFLTYTVFWKPVQTGGANLVANDPTGMGGNTATVRNSFFQATGVNLPLTGVYSVYANNFGGTSQALFQQIQNLAGGTRNIQFPSTGPVTLTTGATQAAGFTYNTATDFGQSAFIQNRANTGIFWAGDYYVGFTGDAANSAGNGRLECGTNLQNLDQFFTVTCNNPVDPVPLLTGSELWSGTQSTYFGAAPFITSPSGFRTVTIFAMTSPAADANIFQSTPGGGSSVSYMLSYRVPYTIAPNATDPAPTISIQNQVNFISVYQNPLLINPLNGMSAITPRFGNAWSQAVSLNMPGTWRISTFATNGCGNTTGGHIDLQAYCYDTHMPMATLSFKVRANVQGCTTPVVTNENTNYGDYCDVTSADVIACQTVTAIRGPLLKGPNSFFRRRLLSDEEEVAAAASSASSGRRLLQAGPIAAQLCGQNQQIAAPAPPAQGPAFNSPINGQQVQPSYSYQAGGGGYSVTTTAMLSPNWAALVTLYYNSFDITPTYTPGSGDVRNFYGMGDLFSNGGRVSLGIGASNTRISYQGAFESLTISSDTSATATAGSGRVFSASNNLSPTWFNINSWSTTWTSGTNALPSWVPSSSPNGAYSNMCSWQPVGTLNPISGVTTGSSAYNGQSGMNMTLVGCSAIGMTVPLTGNVANAPAQFSAGVQPTPTDLVVSARGLPAGGRLSSNLFAKAATATRVTTFENSYDFQFFVWNGVRGSSCYDYRAVRVRAMCNRLVPGVAGGRSGTAEGPLTYMQKATDPAPTVLTGLGNVLTIPVAWNLGAFETVNIMGLFQYLQCGSGPAMPTGTASDNCGSQPGSVTGEGNYFSLGVAWNVISAPTASMFDVGANGIVNGTMSPITEGPATPTGPVTSVVDPLDRTRTINYQYYTRTNTWTIQQYQKRIILLNHGVKYPLTSFRPDVEGTYQIQLTLDDGCSVWNGAAVTISANCENLSLSLGAFSGIVKVSTGGVPVTATALNVSPSQYSLQLDGSMYNRITMQVDPPVPTGYYFTYRWTITQQNGATVNPTNMQGNVASFVPEPAGGEAVNSINTYSVVLRIATNCMQNVNGVATPQVITFSANFNVTCTLNSVAPDNFRFFTPYVSSWTQTANLPNYWGVTSSGASNFISTINDANNANTQLYYAQNRLLGNLGVSSQTGSPINCDPTGPYCGPYGTGTQTVPTILFGGSVPPLPAGFTASVAWGGSTTWAITNGVTGAHFQGLYFSVPATLTQNLCKIKSTYWVLTNYQNALPFVPDFVPARTTSNFTLCTPTQVWSWTITATPCQTCANSLDVCDFDPYYMYNTILVNNQFNSAYTAPSFRLVNQAVSSNNGNLITPFCVYSANQRLSGLPNNANHLLNCQVSGRGLSVIVSQSSSPQGNAYPMDQIAFVPAFPGTYGLELNVFDGCGPAVSSLITITAMCRKQPVINAIKPATTAYYYCSDTNNGNGQYGVPNAPGVNGVAPGKFEPVLLNTMIAPSGISYQDGTVAAPVRRACAVQQTTARWNCSDVKNYVNSQDIAVDTSEVSPNTNKFKACCTCLYGSQVINVNSGTGNRSPPPSPNPGSGGTGNTGIGPTTQSNILALSDAEYNKNYIILVAIVTPLAVLLVASLAGNVLMALKIRGASGSSGGGYNVRAGDVELSTSPRARVDV